MLGIPKGLVCIPLLVSAGATTMMAYYHHHRYKHWSVHHEGRMYRSAWLEPDVLQQVIRRHNIRTVVNLCTPGEMGPERTRQEREAVRRAGARLLEIPMPTATDPADPRVMRHRAVLANPANYPMLVHCQHGVKRTAKFLTIYDIIHRGMTAEESLSAQPLFGREKHPAHIWALARRLERRYRTESRQRTTR